LLKKWIITLVFEKNRQYYREILAKIGEINDHNIDPRLFRFGVGLLCYDKESVGIPRYIPYSFYVDSGDLPI
jgi:hypothetical protein